MGRAAVNKEKNPIIHYKVQKMVEQIEYAKGKDARRTAWVTCKEEGCSNARAKGSSRCADHKMVK